MLYKGRLVISKQSTLILTLLHTFHDSIFEGHSGFLWTYKRTNGELHWKGIKANIKKYMEQCDIFPKEQNKVNVTNGPSSTHPFVGINIGRLDHEFCGRRTT